MFASPAMADTQLKFTGGAGSGEIAGYYAQCATREAAHIIARQAIMRWQGPDIGLREDVREVTLDSDLDRFPDDTPDERAARRQRYEKDAYPNYVPELATGGGHKVFVGLNAAGEVTALIFHRSNQINPEFKGMLWSCDMNGTVLGAL